MKNKKIIALALLVASLGTSAYAGEQVAWEKKNPEQYKKEVAKQNESSFVASLSPYYAQQYKKMTPEEKRKAMEYADNNKMSPDAAIDKVIGR
jgi:hypothetical protein